MEDRFQAVEEVATSLGWSPDETARVLEEMADAGLVMTTTQINPTFYAPLPWLTGWGDWTAEYEDHETALLQLQYYEGRKAGKRASGDPIMQRNVFRTVPAYEALPDKANAAPYDDLRKILMDAGSIAVADCFCETHRKNRGESVREPTERCFLFGAWADYLIEKKFARRATVDESMEILASSAKAGLVHNVADLLRPNFICNCADACGGNLFRSKSVRAKFGEEARQTNYFAKVDSDCCTGCETCLSACWFGAITMGPDEVVEIDTEFCAGCGLCTMKCKANALSLTARPEEEHYVPVQVHPNIRSSEEYWADLERYRDIIRPKSA